MAITALFCAYRLATFRLLPLDAPGTLHATLWPWFARFNTNHAAPPGPEAAWISYGYGALLLPVSLALLAFSVRRGFLPWRSRVSRVLCSRQVFFLSVAVCLVYWRFPLLLGGATNVDEAEFSAAATKLLVDPVFFRAVDCNTSGPFNIFPLALPALFGISPDYATAGLIAIALIFLSLYVLHRALRLLGADELGRIAILPAVGFLSLTQHPDFICYSSELVSMVLTSLAVLACVRVILGPRGYTVPMLWLGVLLSAAFFSKMQSVPIIAAAAAAATVSVYVSGRAQQFRRAILLLAAGFAPLQIINALILWAAGAGCDFWMAYIVANWKYGRSAGNLFSDTATLASTIVAPTELHFLAVVLVSSIAASMYLSIRGKGSEHFHFIEVCAITGLTVAAAVQVRSHASPVAYQRACTAALLMAAASIVFLALKSLIQQPRDGMFGVVSSALLGAAIFAVYAPHHILPHYLELLIIPISTVMGWLLIRTPGPATAAVGVRSYRTLSTVICFVAMTVGGDMALLNGVGRNFYAAQPQTALPEGRMIDSITSPGSSIVVWGWRPEIYLSSGRIPATRDTNMSRLFLYGKDLNRYYQDRFLRDLKSSRAALIVDALNVSCCYLNKPDEDAFELVPAINDFIHAHYLLVSAKYNERFYLRRDLAR